MSIGTYGFGLTTVKFDDKVFDHGQGNLKIRYFGFANVLGVSRINASGHYDRLPYLFKPSWGAKELVAILSIHTSISMMVGLAILGYAFFTSVEDP